MTHAIVSVGVGQWYPKGVRRLSASLDTVGDASERHFFVDALPRGAPTHSAMPYAFKFWAIEQAIGSGADVVLWCDASCWAIRSLEPVWQHIEQEGLLLMECPHALGTWSTDTSLRRLGLSRDEAMGMMLVVGGFFGVSTAHPRGRQFLARVRNVLVPEVFCGDWNNNHRQCSADPRVAGHRHDQVAMGFVAREMGAELVKQPKYFAYDSPSPDPSTVVVARGM